MIRKAGDRTPWSTNGRVERQRREPKRIQKTSTCRSNAVFDRVRFILTTYFDKQALQHLDKVQFLDSFRIDP
ncbi:MAG: hypothetical protein CLLPBCKN_000086 [Chroococcidiopsis cubana SAG 39.79]|nr:hypothetical protein [Chroococcidiopsis cubana SAG 39.79]